MPCILCSVDRSEPSLCRPAGWDFAAEGAKNYPGTAKGGATATASSSESAEPIETTSTAVSDPTETETTTET